MKTVLAKLFRRIGDLTLKLISVKGVLTLSSFIVYFKNPTEWAFWLIITFGGLFVIGREWGKYLEILKIIRK